jgi:hypothetical protein
VGGKAGGEGGKAKGMPRAGASAATLSTPLHPSRGRTEALNGFEHFPHPDFERLAFPMRRFEGNHTDPLYASL